MNGLCKLRKQQLVMLNKLGCNIHTQIIAIAFIIVNGYERNIRTYMIFLAGVYFLIFGANQAAVQIVGPYPPFGLATITVLNVAAFLMLVGIYNSATLVSANNQLRKSIHKHVLETRLLRLIGHAEMEKEIEKTEKKLLKTKID